MENRTRQPTSVASPGFKVRKRRNIGFFIFCFLVLVFRESSEIAREGIHHAVAFMVQRGTIISFRRFVGIFCFFAIQYQLIILMILAMTRIGKLQVLQVQYSTLLRISPGSGHFYSKAWLDVSPSCFSFFSSV